MEILTHPNKLLKEKVQEVIEFDDKLRFLIDQMFEVLNDSQFGVALAAPQIGVLKNIAVFDIKRESSITGSLALVNIKINELGDLKLMAEGCLSLPHIWENIERYERVKVFAQDDLGKKIEMEFDGMFAQAIQHEVDHFDGKCLLDKLPADRRKVIERQLRRKVC